MIRVVGSCTPMNLLLQTTTQYASPELVGDIVYGGREAGDDPRWWESGAPTHGDYTRWCGQWCGMACLHMVLSYRDGRPPSLYELLAAGLPYGTYVPQPDGSIRGLFYDAFIAGTLAFHNPSGHTADTRAAELDAATFETFYAHRAISLRVAGGPGASQTP